MHGKLIAAYVLTFLMNGMLCITVNAFTYSKKDILKAFEITTVEMGNADSLHCLTAIVGILCLMFSPQIKKYKAEIFLAAFAVHGFGILLMPLAFAFGLKHKYCVYISESIFGSTYSLLWPSILFVVKEYRQLYGSDSKNKQEQQRLTESCHDRFIVSVWANSCNIASISCHFLFDYLSYSLKIEWNYLFIWTAVIQILLVVAIYVYLKNNQEESFAVLEQEEQQNRGVSQPEAAPRLHYKTLLKVFWKSRERVEIFVIYLSMRAVINQYEFMTAFYLTLLGFEGHQGKIISFFYFCSFFSPFVLSAIDYLLLSILVQNFQERANSFEQQQQISGHESPKQSGEKSHIFSFSCAIALSVVLVVILLMLLTAYRGNREYAQPQSDEILVQYVLWGLFGLFIGGPSNISYTVNILHLMSSPGLMKDVEREQSVNSSGRLQSPNNGHAHGYELSLNEGEHSRRRQTPINGSCCWMDKDTSIIGSFQICFQLSSIALFLLVYKILSISPQSYLICLAVLVLVALLTDLSKGIGALRTYTEPSNSQNDYSSIPKGDFPRSSPVASSP